VEHETFYASPAQCLGPAGNRCQVGRAWWAASAVITIRCYAVRGRSGLRRADSGRRFWA
jgi:hypothetical protein